MPLTPPIVEPAQEQQALEAQNRVEDLQVTEEERTEAIYLLFEVPDL